MRQEAATGDGVLALTAMGLRITWWHGSDWRWTAGESRCLVVMVERLGRPVRVYDALRIGVLLYRLPQLVKANIFWEFVAGPRHFAEIEQLERGQASFAAYLDRYAVDVLVFPNGTGSQLPPMQSMGWRVIHLDNKFFMMIRQTDAPQFPTYRHIRADMLLPVTRDRADQVLTEANRALERCGEEASFAYAYRSLALMHLGQLKEGLEAFRQVPDVIGSSDADVILAP